MSRQSGSSCHARSPQRSGSESVVSPRTSRSLPFLAGFLVATSMLVAVAPQGATPDQALLTASLGVAAAVLARSVVNLPRGRLNLTAIATQAGGMLLPASLAAAAGLVSGMASYPPTKGTSPLVRWTMWADHAFRWTIGASVHAVVAPRFGLFAADLSVVAINTAGNWISVGLMVHAVHGERVRDVWARNWSSQLPFAFVAFGSAAMLIAFVVRHAGPLGYVYALLVVLLAVSLRSHVSLAALRPTFGRSVVQLSTQAAYLETLEGGLHDLRNLIMVALQLAEEESASPHVRSTLAEAAGVAGRTLQHRAATMDQYVRVDLRDLMARAVELVKPLASQRRVEVSATLPSAGLQVYGDPILLVELLTNLCLNGIQASGAGGRIELSALERRNGSRVVRVRDSGSGFFQGVSMTQAAYVPPVEPGHGIGLRWCQTVALEHLGRVRLESSSKSGSVLMLTLPDPDHAIRHLASIRRRASAGKGTSEAASR